MSNNHKKKVIELLQLLDQQIDAADSNKLSNYKPHHFQEEFHKSNHKIRLFVAGNRSGKSVTTALEAIWLCLGIHPYHPRKLPVNGKLYSESFPTLMETLKLKFDQWLPRKFLNTNKPYLHNQMGHLIGINFANGSKISFGSYDQMHEKSEGSAWDFIGFDEPPPRALYIANMRGAIDSGGIMWISATPLKEAWIYDDIWVPGLTGAKSYIKCINCTSADNPYINKQSLDLFISELTDAEKEVRFYGKFSRLSGLVYDTYDPLMSDVDPFELDDNFVIYEGIDPHPHKPHAVLWKAVHKEGFRYIVKELKFSGTIWEMGKAISEIRKELTDNGAVFVKSVCDTSLNQTDANMRINLKDELSKSLKSCGETITPYNAQKKDWLYPGIQKLRDLYRPVIPEQAKEYFLKNEQIPARPMQYVFKTCTQYKYELSHYQWGNNITDSSKPIAQNNDLLDCDRYIESVAPHYHTPGSTFIHSKHRDAYSRNKNNFGEFYDFMMTSQRL